MPKMKTHRGTKKRVKVTGSGKISLRHSGKSHILTKKTHKRKKRLGQDVIAPKGAERKIKIKNWQKLVLNIKYKEQKTAKISRRKEDAKSKNRNS